jgi:hypothetical protein
MTHNETPKRSRRAMVYRAVAMLASLGFVSVLVMTSSRAAFVDTTDNTSNQFTAGTVALDDDDAGTVLFNVSNLAPSSPRQNCIRVSYTGSLAANVRMYGAASGSLAQYLDVTVEVGTGGTFADCTGFSASGGPLYSGTLSNFASTRTNFTNGLAGWNGATNPSNRTYRITVTMQDDNAAQGLSANADFTWEAQNT